MQWNVVFSTEHPRYGGCGTVPLNPESEWQIQGQGAYLMIAIPEAGKPRQKKRIRSNKP
jgi:hypothetical protein